MCDKSFDGLLRLSARCYKLDEQGDGDDVGC